MAKMLERAKAIIPPLVGSMHKGQAGKIAVIPPKAKLDPMRSFCRKSALFCRKKRPVLFHVEPNAPNPAANRASAPQSIPRATAATEHFYYRTLLLAPKGGHS